MGKRCKNCGACQECGAPALPWNPRPIYPWMQPYYPYWSVQPPYGTPSTVPRITYGNSANSPATTFNYSAIGGATSVASTTPLH